MDETIKLWDANTGEHIKTLTGHTGSVYSVAFHPDGHTLASGSSDETIRLSDANTGELLKTLVRYLPSSVAFHPDGHTIASGSWNKTIHLSDANTGETLRTLKGHTSGVRSVAFHPDGHTIASGSGSGSWWDSDNTIRLWDTNTGEHIRTLEGHTRYVRSVAFHPDGHIIASGSDDKTIRLWDANTGEHIKTLEGHTGYYLNSVVFHPDGHTLASGSSDETIRLWDANTGEHIKTLKGHTEGVASVAFHPDGHTIASGSWDETIRLWDANTGEHIKTLKGHTEGVASVAFHPDGHTIASGSPDKTIRLWDANTGEHIKTLKEPTDVYSVAFHPDGHTIATSGSRDGTIRLWHVDTGGVTPNLPSPITVSLSHKPPIVSSKKSLDLVATVENTGEVAAAVTLQFYGPVKVENSVTDDALATIDFTGKELGKAVNIKTLDAESKRNLGERTTFPDEPGTYAYKACIQRTDGAGETEEICSDVITVTVVSPITVSLSPKPLIVSPKKSLDLVATVENTGEVAAAVTLQFYGPVKVENIGTDGTLPTIDFTGKELGKAVNIKTLNAESKRNLGERTTAPEEPGTYAYKACVQRTDSGEETEEICSDIITVTVAPPDLQFEEIWAESKLDKVWTKTTTVQPGKEFKLSATVGNPGGKSGETTLWWYYLGDDADTEEPEELQGSRIWSVPVNDDTATVTKHITVTAPEDPGTYFYRLTIANVDGEANTDNNSSDFEITVGGPDLVIDSIWATRNEDVIEQVEIHNNFNLHVRVKNEGNTKSEKTTLRYYRSINQDVSNSDLELYEIDGEGNFDATHKSHSVPALEPGGEAELFFETRAPNKVSNYYYRAEVTNLLSEIDIDNNGSNVLSITYKTDLWPYTISQVAHSPGGYTYFVVNPPAYVAVPGVSGAKITVKTCSVTLHTPESGYFMFPLDSPQGIALDTVDNVDKGTGLVLSIIGVLPDGLVKKTSWLETLKGKVDDVFDGILGTVLSVIEIFGGLIDIAIDVINPDDPTDPPTLTVKPTDGFWTAFRNYFVDDLLSLDNYEYEPFLPPTLFVLRENLPSIDITVKQEYILNDDETKHLYTYQYTRTWNLKESAAAAPSARSMLVANYAPFQQLSPEVQAYLLQFLEIPDFWQTVKAFDAQPIPEKTSLLPNYPNPFNPETWIPYQLAKPGDVKLTIYDINGRVVRALDLGHQRAGTYRSRSRAAHWDGKNRVGEAVASGVYFYTFTSGDFSATRKMLIRK